jgi:hypothetical protein
VALHSLIVPTGYSTNSCSGSGVTSKRCWWKIVSAETGITTLEELKPSLLGTVKRDMGFTTILAQLGQKQKLDPLKNIVNRLPYDSRPNATYSFAT